MDSVTSHAVPKERLRRGVASTIHFQVSFIHHRNDSQIILVSTSPQQGWGFLARLNPVPNVPGSLVSSHPNQCLFLGLVKVILFLSQLKK